MYKIVVLVHEFMAENAFQGAEILLDALMTYGKLMHERVEELQVMVELRTNARCE